MAQILWKAVGYFRYQSAGQAGFLVGHVRCPTFISATERPKYFQHS